jgi:hypothetical protein
VPTGFVLTEFVPLPPDDSTVDADAAPPGYHIFRPTTPDGG